MTGACMGVKLHTKGLAIIPVPKRRRRDMFMETQSSPLICKRRRRGMNMPDMPPLRGLLGDILCQPCTILKNSNLRFS